MPPSQGGIQILGVPDGGLQQSHACSRLTSVSNILRVFSILTCRPVWEITSGMTAEIWRSLNAATPGRDNDNLRYIPSARKNTGEIRKLSPKTFREKNVTAVINSQNTMSAWKTKRNDFLFLSGITLPQIPAFIFSWRGFSRSWSVARRAHNQAFA